MDREAYNVFCLCVCSWEWEWGGIFRYPEVGDCFVFGRYLGTLWADGSWRGKAKLFARGLRKPLLDSVLAGCIKETDGKGGKGRKGIT